MQSISKVEIKNNFLILGLRSEIGKEYADSMQDEKTLHLSICDEEFDSKLSTCYRDAPVVVVDFTVYPTRKEIHNAVERLKCCNVKRYVMLSTLMHGKERSINLSAYRKLKLYHERVLLNTFNERLLVTRLPDVIDSKVWKEHLFKDGSYRFRSNRVYEKNLLGTTKREVIEHVKVLSLGGQCSLRPSVPFVLNVVKASTLRVRCVSLLKKVASRSLLISEFLASRPKSTNSDRSNNTSVAESDIAGGFADLL